MIWYKQPFVFQFVTCLFVRILFKFFTLRHATACHFAFAFRQLQITSVCSLGFLRISTKLIFLLRRAHWSNSFGGCVVQVFVLSLQRRCVTIRIRVWRFAVGLSGRAIPLFWRRTFLFGRCPRCFFRGYTLSRWSCVVEVFYHHAFRSFHGHTLQICFGLRDVVSTLRDVSQFYLIGARVCLC